MKTTKGSTQLRRALALGTIAACGAWATATAQTTPTTTSFQEGVGGYLGTQDTYLAETLPAAMHGALDAWGWDSDDPNTSGLDAYGLVRFDDIIGAGPGQIPAGATIISARLQLQVWNGSAVPAGELRDVLIAWDEATATWDNFGGEPGAQADEYGASAVAAAPIPIGAASIDVKSSVQAWVSGTSANFGWIVLPSSSTDGVDVRSAEYVATPAERPRLVVEYFVGAVFQDGLNGYAGTQDTYLAESDPTAVEGSLDNWGWDSDDPAGSGLDNYGLVRFDGIVGGGPGQIPAGATVSSATLQLQLWNGSVAPAGEVREALVSWDEATATWNNFGGEPGAQTDEYGAAAIAPTPIPIGAASLDVTSSVQSWVNGTSTNFGWIFVPNNTNGTDVRSAEYLAAPAERPRLLVVYSTCTPVSATDATCDGIDDDCSGSADEDFVPTVTTCGVGACADTGGTICVAGVVLVDTCAPGTPGAEACNSIDDNCDGFVDEGCSGSFSLVAKAFVKTVDGNPVPMWGFALDTGGDCVTGPEAPSVPGPRLKPIGTPNVTITVRNCLAEPISLVIPALGRAPDPTFVDPSNTLVTGTGSRPLSDVTSRMRSFDTEIAPGTSHAYSWTGVRPGTYIYQSGSHPAVQVPMGLYGMFSLDYAAGEAYQGVPYDNEALLIYSEIDPTRPIVPSTLGYAPAYFLVNGEPHPAAAPVLDHPLVANERVLLRFLNAGSQNHVPTLLEGHMRAVGEDAHKYPYSRDQYGVLLPAGKTLDAVWTPEACSGSVALMDRRLWLTNAGAATPGGMLVKFAASHDPAAPVANDDPGYGVLQGATLNVAAPGVLGNDVSADAMTAVLVSGPSGGTLDLNANGSFHYTPNGGFSGTDSFTYRANDCESSGVATVTVTVTPVTNTAPVAVGDGYVVAEDGTLHQGAPGVLGNDSDPELNPITAVLSTGVLHGTLIFSPNGAFDYTPLANYNGPDSFSYRAYDGQLYSAVTTVSLSVTAVNDPPVANDDTARTKRTTAILIPLLANDTDADGNAQINPATRTIVVSPRRGTLVLNPDGSVTYTARPGFLGTDTFSYTVRDAPAATLSNRAVVRVNVTK